MPFFRPCSHTKKLTREEHTKTRFSQNCVMALYSCPTQIDTLLGMIPARNGIEHRNGFALCDTVVLRAVVYKKAKEVFRAPGESHLPMFLLYHPLSIVVRFWRFDVCDCFVLNNDLFAAQEGNLYAPVCE